MMTNSPQTPQNSPATPRARPAPARIDANERAPQNAPRPTRDRRKTTRRAGDFPDAPYTIHDV
jgi:hypothetical protein